MAVYFIKDGKIVKVNKNAQKSPNIIIYPNTITGFISLTIKEKNAIAEVKTM